MHGFFAGAQSVVAQENVLPTHEYYTEEYIAKIYIEEPKRAFYNCLTKQRT